MDIEGSLRELGLVDSNPLIEAVLAQKEEAWRANQYRQQAYDVHTQTESLVMVFCDGWPEMEVTKESAWDDLKETAVPLMRHIIDNFYPTGGTVIRAMAAKLKAGGVISPHRDTHQTFTHSHRIHIPITKVGNAYEINNQKSHSVMNSGAEDRVTFIFDYLPPKAG